MLVSFGLDLSGYSSGRSALAMATASEVGAPIEVTLLTDHPFAVKLKGDDEIRPQLEKEREALVHLMRSGRVFVDVPIDLQGLPTPKGSQYTWELTRRAVDRAFDGLPPLADKLGAVTARFANLFWEWSAHPLTRELGTRVFETYPAASLRVLELAGISYKGTQARCDQLGRWTGGQGTAVIAEGLGLKAAEGLVLDDDGLDATICALCGVIPDDALLQREELRGEIAQRLARRQEPPVPASGARWRAPRGYVLMRKGPSSVTLRRSKWSDAFRSIGHGSEHA